ncbi:MAG: helicase-associated domain-containing protein, partial [Jatrophihabitantaceae bacterium]
MAASPLHSAAHPPASLTDWLRARSDAELAELLRRRPDLVLPAPADLPTLAGRISVRTSVQRAVDGLNDFVLHVLEALVLSTGNDKQVSRAAAAALLAGAAPADVDAGLEDLRTLALMWGDTDRLQLVTCVRESLGTYPAGLGRPAATLLRQVSDSQLAPVLRSLGLAPAAQPQAGAAIAGVLADPDRLATLIAECDPQQREVLEHLAAGPPLGVLRPSRGGTDTSPAHGLALHGLLIPIDGQMVELPREVSLALRPAPLGPLRPQPPGITSVERAAGDLDRLGTTAVLDTLRLVDALADNWTAHAPAQLRSGGVGVRDLRRTAKDLGADESTIAVIAEVAAAAGLINATRGIEPVYLPTEEFDGWRRHDSASRWADLALAWLGMTRQPSLVGHRGDRERLITLLSPDGERGTAPGLRSRVLDTLSDLSPGHAPAGSDEVLARLDWREPRRSTGYRPAFAAIIAEADLLGVTAAGGLTGYSRTLLGGSRAVAEQVLTGALPTPVDHFVVQPDLTVVVPGPPTTALAVELALTADLESTGGASVYRITEASVRRALDSGRSGRDIAAMIAQRSRTPVPQSLSYLIDDLARRHGTLRSGTASSYLRCEDEALLTRALTDRAVTALQ